MQKLKLPTRTERKFIEHRGTRGDVQVEDRPYTVIENKFNELKGCREDVVVPMSDMDILLAGGLDVFFEKDGTRREANWPWSGEDKTKKAAKAAAEKSVDKVIRKRVAKTRKKAKKSK